MFSKFHRSKEVSPPADKLRRSTPTKASRSSPSKSQQNPFNLFAGYTDALEFLEPYPVPAPPYSSLAQSSPRFPVYGNAMEGHEPLPEYTPTIYKLDKFARKLEWVSPYDPSPTRHWKDVLIELNSTQLNIYAVESHHRNFVNHLVTLPDSDVLASKQGLLPYNSSLTTVRDLSNWLQLEKFHLLDKHNLVKSYSLQHAKIGLASDYQKHKFTLRLRCETEQFLIQFPTAESMIDWNLALCLGRDNALDLNKRSMPHYRTVPRRRHHHHHRYRRSRRNRRRNNSAPDVMSRSRSNTVTSFFHRRRAFSEPNTQVPETNFKGKFQAFLRHKPSIINDNNNHEQTSTALRSSQRIDLHASPSTSSSPSQTDIPTHLYDDLEDMDINNDESHIHDDEEDDEVEDEGEDEVEEDDEEEEEEDDEEEEGVDDEHFDTEEEDESITEEVCDALSTIPPLSASFTDNSAVSTSSTSNPSQMTASTLTTTIEDDDLDLKWYPEFDRLPSKKKLVKDAIRCMATLSITDRWCGKSLVKAYDYDRLSRRITKDAVVTDKISSQRNSNGQLKFVKEYIVTSSGLMPTT